MDGWVSALRDWEQWLRWLRMYVYIYKHSKGKERKKLARFPPFPIPFHSVPTKHLQYG